MLQMAGSDLDGDIYFVSWDSRLFPPPLRRNAPPLDYAAIQPDYVDKVGAAVGLGSSMMANHDNGMPGTKMT